MRTITIAAHNRPKHLQMLLDSLKSQLHPVKDYEVIISVDAGGDKFNDVMKVAKSINAQVFSTEHNVGINRNTYWLMEYAFDVMRADWNVYLEDDLVLSPDAFNLVEWYIAHTKELGTVGAYCLCRLREHGAPDKVFLDRGFCAWGFLMNGQQWERFAKPIWCSSQRSWDVAVAAHIREQGPDIYNAFPALSRVTNTGYGGTHFTESKLRALMKNHVYSRERRVYSFQFTGIRS